MTTKTARKPAKAKKVSRREVANEEYRAERDAWDLTQQLNRWAVNLLVVAGDRPREVLYRRALELAFYERGLYRGLVDRVRAGMTEAQLRVAAEDAIAASKFATPGEELLLPVPGTVAEAMTRDEIRRAESAARDAVTPDGGGS